MHDLEENAVNPGLPNEGTDGSTVAGQGAVVGDRVVGDGIDGGGVVAESGAFIENVGVTAEGSSLTRAMDALSLTQALLDFEMANTRVLDLTARLVESNARVIKLQTAIDETAEKRTALETGFAAERNNLIAQVQQRQTELHEQQTAVAVAQQHAVEARAELAATHASKTFRVARAIKRLTGLVSK